MILIIFAFSLSQLKTDTHLTIIWSADHNGLNKCVRRNIKIKMRFFIPFQITKIVWFWAHLKRTRVSSIESADSEIHRHIKIHQRPAVIARSKSDYQFPLDQSQKPRRSSCEKFFMSSKPQKSARSCRITVRISFSPRTLAKLSN